MEQIMDKSAKTFGFNLLRLRKKKGIRSQEALAKLIGVSRQVIKAAEEGRSVPQAVNRGQIAEALDVDEAEFWRDPSEFDPQNARTEKVQAAVKSVLEAAGYRIEDLPELFGFSAQRKSRAPKVDRAEEEAIRKDKAMVAEYEASQKAAKKKRRPAG
jgi:transcriptional regulator with XRE-family HTH domain